MTQAEEASLPSRHPLLPFYHRSKVGRGKSEWTPNCPKVPWIHEWKKCERANRDSVFATRSERLQGRISDDHVEQGILRKPTSRLSFVHNKRLQRRRLHGDHRIE